MMNEQQTKATLSVPEMQLMIDGAVLACAALGTKKMEVVFHVVAIVAGQMTRATPEQLQTSIRSHVKRANKQVVLVSGELRTPPPFWLQGYLFSYTNSTPPVVVSESLLPPPEVA